MSGMNDYKSEMPLQVTHAEGNIYRDFTEMLKALIFAPSVCSSGWTMRTMTTR